MRALHGDSGTADCMMSNGISNYVTYSSTVSIKHIQPVKYLAVLHLNASHT